MVQLPVVQNRRGTVKWIELKCEVLLNHTPTVWLSSLRGVCIERSDDGPMYVVIVVEPNSSYQYLKIAEAVRLALDSISYQMSRKMGSLELCGFQLTEVHNIQFLCPGASCILRML